MPKNKTIKIEPQKIQMVKVDELIPYVRNPRAHSDEQIYKLARIIKDIGFKGAILVDKHNEIIAGHGRLLAAKKLGLDTVPVIIDATITPAQVKALRIADNKIGEESWWIDEYLNQEMIELEDINFDLELTGFDFEEYQEQVNIQEKIKGKNSSRKEKNSEFSLKPKSFSDLAPDKAELARISGKQIIIEFSGGKDSLATALWAKAFFPELKFILLYCDLGSEFVGIQPYLYDVAELLEVELVVLRSEINIMESFLKQGKWPHWHHPYCQQLLFSNMDSYLKNNYRPERIIILRGGIGQQKNAAVKKQKTRFIKIERMKDFTYFQPLYFINRKTEEKLLKESHIPLWQGYSTGLQRTACRICPGQRPSAYAAIRQNHPDSWEELLWLENKLGSGCWQNPVTKSVKGKQKTIRQATFKESAEKGQSDFEKGGYTLRPV